MHSASLNREYFLFQYACSNNLAVYNRNNYSPVRMLTGEPDDPQVSRPDTFRVKQSQEAQDQVLWYSGGSSFTLVNCAKNFEKTTFEDFLAKEGQDGPVDLIMAISITHPVKILALCVNSAGSYLLKSFDVLKSKGRWFNCADMSDEKKTRHIRGRLR